MPIRRLYDLQDEKLTKGHIVRCFMGEFSSQEYMLSNHQSIESSIESILETMDERGDMALIAQSAFGSIVGYALLTKQKNTWTGAVEGFVYMLWMERFEATYSFIEELFEAIRAWGKEYGCQLMRVEVREREQNLALIERLHSLGWVTSCLIPCKILSSSDFAHTELKYILQENISIRPGREEDYPFIIRLLSEAIWDGLSIVERLQLNFDVLADNIHQDFVPALSNGTAISFVKESAQDGLCAHATTIIDGIHPFLNVPEAELVDIFVLPAFNERGISSELTVHTLSACRERGIRFVHGTIVVEHASPLNVQQVRTYLEHTGWWINARLLYKWLV